MYPKLYTRQGQLLAVLNNIIKESASVKRVVNGEFTFTFEAFEEELKSEYFSEENVIVLDNQTFDLKYVEQKHAFDVSYSIQCEHVNYRLEDGEANLHEAYIFTGTPTQVLANILQGTEFSVGVVDFTDNITITASDITKKALIYQVAGLLGGEVDYTNLGFTINIKQTIGQDNGFEVRFGKNLIGVTKFIDRRGELTVAYAVDIIELKNTNEYIEKELQGLEVINAGDTVRVVDEVIGLNIQNRIVSVERNPIFELNTKLEIANKIETIVDRIKEIETKTVKTEKLYNNVSISNEYGFRAERSDLKARIDMNATEGLAVFSRSDIEDAYVKNLTIDADGNIVMTGKINLIQGSDISSFGLKALAYEDYVDWDTNLIHIPNALKAPAGKGLFISPTHMGFHDAATGGWRTYMDGDGNFFLGGAAGKLQWNSNTNVLTINGAITMGAGSSGISNLSDAGALATKDAVNFANTEVINKTAEYISETIGRKWAAQSGADVTGSNIAAGFNGQGALATLSQISTVHITNNAITAPLIQAGAIIASKIAVDNLSAISADLGTVNAGELNGVVINGGSINVITDVNVGQKLKLNFASQNASVEFGTALLNISGTNIETLTVSKSITFNGTAISSVAFLPRSEWRVNTNVFYGTIELAQNNNHLIVNGGDIRLTSGTHLQGSWEFRNTGGVNATVDFTQANVTGGVKKVHVGPTAPSDTSGNTIWIKT